MSDITPETKKRRYSVNSAAQAVELICAGDFTHRVVTDHV